MKFDITIPGWTPPSALLRLGDFASRVANIPDGQILVHGSWVGRSLYHIAANAPTTPVTVVHPPTMSTMTKMFDTTPQGLLGDADRWRLWNPMVTIDAVAFEVLHRYKMTNVTMVDDLPQLSSDTRFDFIFTRDLTTDSIAVDQLTSLLASGGILCGRSYQTMKRGVDVFVENSGWSLTVFDGLVDLWVLCESDAIATWWFDSPRHNW